TDVPELRTVQAPRGRRGLLVLALILPMVVALIASVFWPLRIFRSDASLHTTTSSKNHPRAHLTPMPTATPTPMPTATPTPMPTATPTPMPTAVPGADLTATALAASSNPYPPYSGKLTLDDPLRDNSRGYGW